MEFQSRAVRAMIILQINELRLLVEAWRRARTRGIVPPRPPFEEPDYESLDHVMRHPLRSSRGYLRWICEFRGRSAPEIRIPEPHELDGDAEAAVDRLDSAWREHMADVADAELEPETRPSRWGTPYTIEQMMEHAIAHAMRHRLQLEGWLEEA